MFSKLYIMPRNIQNTKRMNNFIKQEEVKLNMLNSLKNKLNLKNNIPLTKIHINYVLDVPDKYNYCSKLNF